MTNKQLWILIVCMIAGMTFTAISTLALSQSGNESTRSKCNSPYQLTLPEFATEGFAYVFDPCTGELWTVFTLAQGDQKALIGHFKIPPNRE